MARRQGSPHGSVEGPYPCANLTVGITSREDTVAMEVRPAGTTLGHQATQGTRTPPSYVEPLPSRRAPLEPPS